MIWRYEWINAILVAIMVLLNPLWIARSYSRTPHLRSDFILALLVFGIATPQDRFLQLFNLFGVDVCAMATLLAVTLALMTVLSSSTKGPSSFQRETGYDDIQAGSTAEMDRFPIPPLLIPARTTHTRFFPKKHSFSYSYFYVGIPIGWRGCSGTALSADVELVSPLKRRRGWFDVNSNDHLDRYARRKGLKQKLMAFLNDQGVPEIAWNFAYLCTAPRFLGYSFNPVSFWYLYDKQMRLTMMILEVNNTFDERRMYLLKADDCTDTSDKNDQITVRGNKFKNTWEKDFHVSPFNSRKGSYTLSANDPYHHADALKTAIDNVITLRSSKEHVKLVARVFSEGKVIEPSEINNIQLLTLIFKWFWVGFLTFPRILFEAYRLFFSRKLHVWFRPEVLQSSIGRRVTTEEIKLASYIRSYFKGMVERSSLPLKLTYMPPSDVGEPETWESSQDSQPKTLDHVSLTILSPAFFSRFVHYRHTVEALDREGLCTDEKNKTVSITGAAALDRLVRQDAKLASKNGAMSGGWRWKIMQRLRCAPPAVSYGETTIGQNPAFAVSDIRASGLSALDRFVLSSYDARKAAEYRRLVCEAFLAQRVALGFVQLIRGADMLLRSLLLILAYRMPPIGTISGWHDAPKMMFVATAASLVHIWSFAKG